MKETFTKVIDLLYLAKQDEVEIILNNGRLQLKVADDKNIDERLLDSIRANKDSIIDFLSNEEWKLKIVETNHKIIKVDKTSTLRVPLSFSQERLWFIDQLEGSLQYHITAVLRLRGYLDIEALNHSLNEIVNRHEILRTVYIEDGGQAWQHIKPENQWKLKVTNWDKNSEKDKLDCYIQTSSRKPFNLSEDHMLRAELIDLGSEEHMLVVTTHHIASDAWSTPILVNEVGKLYTSYTGGSEADLPALNIQYSDFALWQRSYLKGEQLESKLSYWKHKLEGVAPLQLPLDFTRPNESSNRGSSVTFTISSEVRDQLRGLAQSNDATLYMTLLAVFKVLLYRYAGQEDICVGTSIAGRPQVELEGLIGFFVNTLALRSNVKGQLTFVELLEQVRETMVEAYANQEVPFEKVVETVVKEREPNRNPLFDAMLVLKNTPDVPELRLGKLVLSAEPYEHTTVKFDLTFFLTESPRGIHGSVLYSTDLFSRDRIQRMIEHFSSLMDSVIKNPLEKVGVIPMVSATEEVELTGGFNNYIVAYPREATVVSLFEEQVIKTPEATALVHGGEELRYEALNERANQVAHYLRSRGVKEDSLVPIFIERGVEMIVGIVGILKAGAAYVPIDTDFPDERISYMLEDTAARIVVSSRSSRKKLPGTYADIIETDAEELQSYPTENPKTRLEPQHLAYVIYTSGSTGRPKGVMIEHRSLVDYVFGLNEKIETEQCKSYGLVPTIATDLGNTVIYSSLLLGGALHIFSKEAVSNIAYLHNYFAAHIIDCLKIVPSHWKVLCNEEALLLPQKLLVFGGEALQSEVIAAIKATGSNCRIINHYGPTETTIGKLLHRADTDRRYNNNVPIGKPFSNTNIYVLSKELQLCPAGVPGQLYIAGDGVGRGYLNNEELTRSKFIKNPFSKEAGRSVMYATGDLVKQGAEGDIEFIGRVDDQVKIRGYRVELGEIESILQQSELVKQAVVLAREDKQGNKRLVGYVVPQGWFEREEILGYLKEKLPEYMVPQVLTQLESLPLTANGKVDRKALPDPEATNQAADEYVAPRNEAERKLAEIWQHVLEVEQVGVHDDFFELGGHSLLAVRLISAIRKAFEVELPISHVFDYPTVALLAAQLESQSSTSVLPSIQVIQRGAERIPLSFSQERLWFIDKLEGSVQYHVPAVLGLKGSLNKDALEFALKTIVNRHEVLRTVFTEQDGQAYQQIKDNNWQLSVTEGLQYKEDRKGLEQYIQQLINHPFDLSRDDMLRAELIRLSEEEHVLVATLHHIASDGWSRSILVKEVVELYAAFEEDRPVRLEPPAVQYADYALWQRNYLQGEVLDSKLQYWKDKLQDVEALQLSTDHVRPAVQTTKGATRGFAINKEISDQLQQLSRKNESTLFMTLLAAFKVLLYRYSGQENICIGTPVAGRQQQELEGLLGFFLNTLALRTSLNSQGSFSEFLQQVRTATLEAYEHQEVPFEKVVEAVVKERDISRTALFQVMFILQNTPEVQQLKLGELQLSIEGFGHDSAKFEITLSITETAGGLAGSFEYNTDLYSSCTIDQMITHFKELITSIVKAPQQKIASLSMLTKAEEHRLLVEFNDTGVAYPKDKTIVSLFEEQVAKSPQNTALIYENKQLTYQKLNEKSNQLARYLQSKGVQQETLVPIYIERSLEMIVGILGILKAGGVYVPIDPEYPAERIKYMLQDTVAKLIVTSKASTSKLPDLQDVETVEIDGEEAVSMQTKSDLKIAIEPSRLAYVIYTSGSTGQPKGVLVEHRNVVSLVKNVNYVSLTDRDILLSTGSSSFDATTFEYWGMLLNGGQLILCSENKLLDSDLLKDQMTNRNVSKMWFTSSWFNYLVDNNISVFETLQTILVGGEKLSEQHIKKIRQCYPSIVIINGYGPTENTTFSLTYQIVVSDIKSPIPIGCPLSNRTAYILDHDGNLAPIGVKGEIYLGGSGLARGYLNRPALTNEKFINVSLNEKQTLRLYKTGDIGRWLYDGKMEYVGRVDEQVKIRGYRIEPGEIESVLLQSGYVNEVVVVVSGEKEYNNNRLVGYVVPIGEFDQNRISSYLHSKLPNYMVPTQWVALNKFPLNKNGKVDKHVLVQLGASPLVSKEYVEAVTLIEKELCDVWQKVLGIEKVGITDNFFQLGGNSIITIQVVSRIKRLGYKIELVDLFLNQSIKSLAKVLQARSTEFVKKNSISVNGSDFGTQADFGSHNFKFLVPIKSGGNKVPLYIVSGGGGTVFKFKKMVDLLDPEQPVFGLQQPTDPKDLKEFPETIEGIASIYISEILLQNATGRIALSGHCAGGIIAYEMSKQLEAIGKKVVFLGMFDTIAPRYRTENNKSEKTLKSIPSILKKSFLKAYFKADFETFLFRRHTKHAFEYKINSLKSLVKRIGPKDEKEEEEDVYQVYKRLENSFRSAQRKYQTLPYDGDIIIYYAKYHYQFLDISKNVRYRKFYLTDSIKNSWKQYAKSIEIYEVEGEHSSMFDPAVGGKELAGLLQEHLNRSNPVI